MDNQKTEGFSLKFQFYIVAFFLATMMIVLVGISIKDAQVQTSLAQKSQTLNKFSGLLNELVTELIKERSVGTISIATKTSNEFLNDIRNDVDENYAEVDKMVPAVKAWLLKDFGDEATKFAAAFDAFVKMRKEVQFEENESTRRRVKAEWDETATKVITQALILNQIAFVPNEERLKVLYYNTVTRPQVMNIVDYLGRLKSLMAEFIKDGRPIEDEPFRLLSTYREVLFGYSENLGFYDKLHETNKFRSKELGKAISDFQRAHETFYADVKKLIDAGRVEQDESVRYRKSIEEWNDEIKEQREKIEKVSEHLGTLGDRADEVVLKDAQFSLWSRIGLFAFSVFLIVGLIYWFNSRIINKLVTLTEVALKVGAGDDRARAPYYKLDEIGVMAATFNNMVDARVRAQQDAEAEYQSLQEGIQSLLVVTADASEGNLSARVPVTEGALGNVADAMNLMLENVGNLIKDVQILAERVAKAAAEIQDSSEQLSEGSSKQTREIVNTTSAVQEMAANIESVSGNAKSASEAANRVQQEAEDGSKAVAQVVDGMNRIRQNVQAGAKKIKRLGERSMEISMIINTINDISAQTDMLALNAAIETTRAGESDHGFTAVAAEVRRLSERTSEATQEIGKLISGMQAETNESVASMEVQTNQVEEESRIVSNAGQSLKRIHESSMQSSELIHEISLASQQQVQGANGVADAMDIVSQIATRAQRETEQTKRGTESLAKLAQDLTASISEFKIE